MPDSNFASDDDLDNFFAAADTKDVNAIQEAARLIQDPEAAGSGERATRVMRQEPEKPAGDWDGSPSAGPSVAGADLFVAIDAGTIGPESETRPFVLIPANVHASLPLWMWVAMALVVIGVFVAVLLIPGVNLNRLTASLGSGSDVAAQSAMRKLVIRGDDATVDKLYAMATSEKESSTARLRAVDALSLIAGDSAGKALLRLELGSGVDPAVRTAAAIARKQRRDNRSVKR